MIGLEIWLAWPAHGPIIRNYGTIRNCVNSMPEHSQSTRTASPGAARWLIVILLAAIATCLLIEVGAGVSPVSAAPAEVPEADSTIVVSGKVTSDSYGMYLVDLKRRTICVYQWLPSSRKFRLMAARNFSYDVQLEDFNNAKPTPREVRELIGSRSGANDVGNSMK